MKEWLFTEVPAGCAELTLPSLAEERGGQRRRELAAALGPAEALVALRAAEPYLLEDDLCRELRLRGLRLPEDGAIPSLDPRGWKETEPVPIPAEACGLLLDRRRAQALGGFLAGRRPASLAELVTVARHYFYGEPVKLITPYTAPRLPRP